MLHHGAVLIYEPGRPFSYLKWRPPDGRLCLPKGGKEGAALSPVNAAVNFPKSAEVKFPNYADGVVMERWLFFGGRPLGFGGGVKAGGVLSAFERTCSGMSSAC